VGAISLRRTGYRFQQHPIQRFWGDAGGAYLIPQAGGKEENGENGLFSIGYSCPRSDDTSSLCSGITGCVPKAHKTS
jgi:hypothetical protein